MITTVLLKSIVTQNSFAFHMKQPLTAKLSVSNTQNWFPKRALIGAKKTPFSSSLLYMSTQSKSETSETTSKTKSTTPAVEPFKINLETIPMDELTTLLKSWKQPPYRAKQIQNWIREQGVTSPSQMTNLPKSLIHLLEEHTTTTSSSSSSSSLHNPLLNVVFEQKSLDGTLKRAYELHDGQIIESVLMPYENKNGRNTACISSQAGCAMGCVFCATGQMGFARQLTSEEIFAQVSRFSTELKQKGERLSNVVMMGMGEPLANYRNVMHAIKRMNEELGIGARKITVSTVGIVPNIRKLIEEPMQIKLAISLHCATEEERSKLLPANKRYGGLDELMLAVKDYTEQTKRRITLEWALIEHQNDSPETARQLGNLLKRFNIRMDLIHINVIPLNPTNGFVDGRPSEKGRVQQFIKVLEKEFGVSATPRMRRGIDIDAGCGQLKSKIKKKEMESEIQSEIEDLEFDREGLNPEGMSPEKKEKEKEKEKERKSMQNFNDFLALENSVNPMMTYLSKESKPSLVSNPNIGVYDDDDDDDDDEGKAENRVMIENDVKNLQQQDTNIVEKKQEESNVPFFMQQENDLEKLTYRNPAPNDNRHTKHKQEEFSSPIYDSLPESRTKSDTKQNHPEKTLNNYVSQNIDTHDLLSRPSEPRPLDPMNEDDISYFEGNESDHYHHLHTHDSLPDSNIDRLQPIRRNSELSSSTPSTTYRMENDVEDKGYEYSDFLPPQSRERIMGNPMMDQQDSIDIRYEEAQEEDAYFGYDEDEMFYDDHDDDFYFEGSENNRRRSLQEGISYSITNAMMGNPMMKADTYNAGVAPNEEQVETDPGHKQDKHDSFISDNPFDPFDSGPMPQSNHDGYYHQEYSNDFDLGYGEQDMFPNMDNDPYTAPPSVYARRDVSQSTFQKHSSTIDLDTDTEFDDDEFQTEAEIMEANRLLTLVQMSFPPPPSTSDSPESLEQEVEHNSRKPTTTTTTITDEESINVAKKRRKKLLRNLKQIKNLLEKERNGIILNEEQKIKVGREEEWRLELESVEHNLQ